VYGGYRSHEVFFYVVLLRLRARRGWTSGILNDTGSRPFGPGVIPIATLLRYAQCSVTGIWFVFYTCPGNGWFAAFGFGCGYWHQASFPPVICVINIGSANIAIPIVFRRSLRGRCHCSADYLSGLQRVGSPCPDRHQIIPPSICKRGRLNSTHPPHDWVRVGIAAHVSAKS